MGWTEKFIKDLSVYRRRPIFALRPIRMAEGVGGADTFSSGQEHSGLQLIAEISTGGTKINPLDWSTQTGTWTVRLAGPVRNAFAGGLARGGLYELVCGFSGYAETEFQPIALGQLWTIARNGDAPIYTLTFRDLLSALASRITTTADEFALFHDTDTVSTTLSGGYTPGDTTLNVSSTSGFSRQDDGGGTLKGAVLVTPASGDPFVLTWTASTAASFSGVSATGQVGTTAVSAAMGDAVTPVAWIDDHPIDAIRRILTSTGTRTNGDYDTLPKSWGYGLPERLVDGEDMDRHVAYSQAKTGSDDWHLYSSAGQSNGLSWMQAILSEGGYFLTMRQGRITVRSGQPPQGKSPYLYSPIRYRTQPWLTDEDLVSVDTWESYDGGYPVEYFRFRVAGPTASKEISSPVQSLPVATLRTQTMSYVYTNEDVQLLAVRDRLKWWVITPPQRFRLTYGGLKLAQMAVGDMPLLNSELLHGRQAYEAGGFFDQPVLVTEVSPDWMRSTVTIEIAVPGDRLFEDFEHGFEDGTLGKLTTSGDADWTVTSSTSQSGTYSAQSGTITHNQSTSLQLQWDVGPDGATLTFYRRTDSEATYDLLSFYIDGVLQTSWSGATAWGQVSYSLPTGRHTLTWTYSKDGSVSTGANAAWVDDIAITQN